MCVDYTSLRYSTAKESKMVSDCTPLCVLGSRLWVTDTKVRIPSLDCVFYDVDSGLWIPDPKIWNLDSIVVTLICVLYTCILINL